VLTGWSVCVLLEKFQVVVVAIWTPSVWVMVPVPVRLPERGGAEESEIGPGPGQVDSLPAEEHTLVCELRARRVTIRPKSPAPLSGSGAAGAGGQGGGPGGGVG
jgi:hypothetical protein